jgi:hypothetical protein
MKYVFYLLILCNIVVYLWYTGVGRERSDVVRYELSLPAESERIALIKELPKIPKKAPEPEAAPKVEEIPQQPTEQPKPQESLTSQAVNDSQAAAEQTQAEAAPKPSRPDCFVLGPYHSESLARKALDGLNPRLEQAQVVTRYGDVEDGYWVLYPKAENLDVARANRRMLMDKGIHDLWLFDKGEMQGAISLGIYKTRQRAEGLQSKFREQNIEVEVKPRTTRAKASWIKIPWQGEQAELDVLVGTSDSERSEPQAPKLRPCD